jgi:hypothetical protein
MQSRKERVKTFIPLRFIIPNAGYQLDFFAGIPHLDDLAEFQNCGSRNSAIIDEGPVGAVVCQFDLSAVKSNRTVRRGDVCGFPLYVQTYPILGTSSANEQRLFRDGMGQAAIE